MKLVEILAREMVEWPEGAAVAVQDLDEGVYFNESARSIEYESEEMGQWIEVNGRSGWIDEWITASVLATDHTTAMVTRSMWEAERAKSETWFASGPPRGHCVVMDVEFPTVSIGVGVACSPEWNGEGLPPVGTVCLGLSECDGEWQGCEVVAHHKGSAVAVFPHGGAMASHGARYRPAPSAEQIAAQKREQAITDLMQTTCIRRGEAARIYDAGYRRQ